MAKVISPVRYYNIINAKTMSVKCPLCKRLTAIDRTKSSWTRKCQRCKEMFELEVL